MSNDFPQSTAAERRHDAGFEDAAQELWHRFAPEHWTEWEDETHQAEYRDAGRAAVYAFLARQNETVTIGELIAELEAADG